LHDLASKIPFLQGLLCSLALGLSSDGKEEFEFWGELVLGVEAVREINAANTAVSVDLHSKFESQLLVV